MHQLQHQLKQKMSKVPLKQVNLNCGGTVTVDGVEKTVEINEDVPAIFDDGSTTKTVEGVGTYTVADGTVTFGTQKNHS